MLKYAKFHHIGIAVSSIEKAMPFYKEAGYEIGDTIIENVQKVRVAYAKRYDAPLIELLEPLDERSPVNNILRKNGCTPYHLCYSVKNLQDAIREAREIGYLPLAKPVPGHGLDDAMMLFLYNKNIGLIQLMEEK